MFRVGQIHFFKIGVFLLALTFSNRHPTHHKQTTRVLTIRKSQYQHKIKIATQQPLIAVSRQHEYRLNEKNLLKGYQVGTDSNMMDSNNNILAMKNGDENGNRPLHTVNRTRTDWGQQQHQSTSYESKNVPISVQHQQRRPFQTLNSNTSSIGSFNSDMFRSSSNTTKPLKVSTFSGLS